MRILLITYHFPPDAEIGSVRPYQFARLLPDHGIEPYVLTVEPQFAESYDTTYMPEGVDPRRLFRTAVDTTNANRWTRALARLGRLAVPSRRLASRASSGPDRIHAQSLVSGRSRIRDAALSWLAYPDARIGWLRPALECAERVIREHSIDAIVSTSPPRVAALIARQLQVRTGLPWLMDMRDPWTGGKPETRTVARLYNRLFQGCATRATAVTVNTERLHTHLAHTVPAIADKLYTVPNGFDPSMLLNEDKCPSIPFSLLYVGYMMGARTAGPFLEGLRMWLDADRPNVRDVSVDFYGGGFERDRAAFVGRLGLESVVCFHPPVARRDVADLMRGSYVLLLFANQQPLQLPGKTFEYLCARRRILTLAEADSATGDMLQGRPGSLVVQTADQAADALHAYWKEYTAGRCAQVDRPSVLAEFTYSRRTEMLADLLHRLGKN